MTLRAACCWFALLAASAAAARAQDSPGPFAGAAEIAQARVVKIYGAALGREKGYASGVLISDDGQIVTTLGILLEASALRVVLPDGRRLSAEVVKRDPVRQLALLKVAADDLTCFALDADTTAVREGSWVLAAANAFKVAEGPEPVTVSLGVLAARAPLAARRRAQEFSYDGPALITDVVTSTPGCAGGALVDARGRLLGVIGKAVISERTNTWVNYAIPVEEVRTFLATDAEALAAAAAQQSQRDAARPVRLGLRLFDVGGRTRPAYIERVRPGSPAWDAGLRGGELILAIGDQPINTCDEALVALRSAAPGRPVEIAVKRGDRVVTVALSEATQ